MELYSFILVVADKISFPQTMYALFPCMCHNDGDCKGFYCPNFSHVAFCTIFCDCGCITPSLALKSCTIGKYTNKDGEKTQEQVQFKPNPS